MTATSSAPALATLRRSEVNHYRAPTLRERCWRVVDRLLAPTWPPTPAVVPSYTHGYPLERAATFHRMSG